jgi:Uma2 family endonuclease
MTTLKTNAEPAWEVATLFPDQGSWSDVEYLSLNHKTNRLVELSDGHIQVLAMPTKSHQRMVLFLYNALLAFVSPNRLGEILVAPYPVRLRERKFREPDVLFMLASNVSRMREEYADGADLVVEVVSDEHRAHDLVLKRAEYEAAGIPEYWIVDYREQRITVLTLREGKYAVHAEAGPGQSATSVLLPGFAVDVNAVFQAAAVDSHQARQ